MPRIEWSIQSRDDLRNIRTYIAKRNPERTGPYVRMLQNFAKRLEQFPTLGEVVHRFRRDDVREMTFDNYRIIYQ
jgi:plasmid stabilization system protein ParE